MDISLSILDYELWMSLLCFSRRTTMLLVVITMTVHTVINAQQVNSESRTELGGTAVFPCKLNGNKENLIQISWQRETKKQPHTVNFYTISEEHGPSFVNGKDERFGFIGNFKEKNGTLQLSNVTLDDEGTYKCIFTLFPSGYVEMQTSLKVIVPPVTNLMGFNQSLGSEEVALATCTAAGSKPPSEVRWLTASLGEKVRVTTDSTPHDNGTTTTVSSLFGVPSRAISHHSVQCVITGPALTRGKTLSFTIQIHYPPLEVIVSESSAESFQCLAEAYPYASYSWTRADGSWPESKVRVDNTTLQFLSTTSKLNGLYICLASNSYGSKRGYLYVHFPVLYRGEKKEHVVRCKEFEQPPVHQMKIRE
ncbi:nectin-1 isoform X2 [Cheilinus undulatus]|uniref:nectin-1 isoform X2 n=1 Tax=Cheilinus undulatus TaxID=241271 RepID=UPI001BD1EF44|nr:nectin-1 isoform X2 [Cheilinus undulatus]